MQWIINLFVGFDIDSENIFDVKRKYIKVEFIVFSRSKLLLCNVLQNRIIRDNVSDKVKN